MSAAGELALVTGASEGIGRAIALRLAQDGHRLALVARRGEALARVQATLAGAGARAEVFPCDLEDPDAAAATAEAVRERCGPPGVLVHNAGAGGPYQLLTEVAPPQLGGLIALNLTSALRLTQAVLPAMAAAGRGRVVSISSVFGLASGPGSAVYTTVKHALLGLTRALAVEWGPRGVTANAVCPGYIETRMLENLRAADPARHAALARSVPAGRLGAAEEVADLVAFLVSPRAAYINGAVITIDGGLASALAQAT